MNIKSIEKLTDCKHLNLYSMTYKDRHGAVRTWVFASRSQPPKVVRKEAPGPDAVVIVPLHEPGGRLVIIREFRVVLGGWQYGFPAGLVDPGESIEHAAGRELKEETGLDLVRIRKAGPPVFSSSGMTDESVSLVYADCSGTPSKDWNEASEDIDVLLLTPEEAADLLKEEGNNMDVKTWILLSVFAEHGTL